MTKLVSAERIREILLNVSVKIQGQKPILLVPIVRGGIVVATDLLRLLPQTTEIAPLVIGMGRVQYTPPWERGRDIWLIDNTISNGLTLKTAIEAAPAGVRSFVMFGLHGQRIIQPTILGMEVNAKLVGGYGADFGLGGRGSMELVDIQSKPSAQYLPEKYIQILENRHGRGFREFLFAHRIIDLPSVHVLNLQELIRLWKLRIGS